MNELTKYQTIEREGETLFYIVPKEDFLRLVSRADEVEDGIPNEVAKSFFDGKSMLQAWRDYRGLSQRALADLVGVSQNAISKMEKPGVKNHDATNKKLAKALGISIVQLTGQTEDDSEHFED